MLNVKRACPSAAKNIIIEGVYTPTEEEVKKGKYTIVVKPKHTTTYIAKMYRRDGRITSHPKHVVVLDKNGIEIKEKNKEEEKHSAKASFYLIFWNIIIWCFSILF